MKFELSKYDHERIDKWLNDIQEDLIKDITDPEEIRKMIYTGAIGGQLTYSFTPTNLGVVVKVTDEFSNNTLDLTDYNDW